MIDPAFHGVSFDGVTDDGPAWKQVFAAMAATGKACLLPSGISLITDQDVYDTNGGEFVPPAGAVFIGQGKHTILRFKHLVPQYASFYGFSIQNDDCTFRDMVLEIDKNGAAWVAAVAVTAPSNGLIFENVTFRGIGANKHGLWGIRPQADCSNLSGVRCHFENLEAGFIKDPREPSTQTGITFSECSATNCREAFEFNSPGYYDGNFSGNAITAIEPKPEWLKPGMTLRSPALPGGATIAAVNASALQITLTAPGPASGVHRFTFGGMRDIVVERLKARNIELWAVGIANCENFRVSIDAEDVQYEAVHIEDYSRFGQVEVSGRRCNLTPGIPPTPRPPAADIPADPNADNGMVRIITGSHDIDVRFLDCDLTQNTGGSPNGVVIIPGGDAGTTNQPAYPTRNSISGTVRVATGCVAVIGVITDIRYDSLTIVNDVSSKAADMTRMLSCVWSGNVRIHNPTNLVRGDNLLQGSWDSVVLISEEAGFPSLQWLAGSAIATVARNAPMLTRRVTFNFRSSVEPGSDWHVLCPAPYTFLGSMSRKIVSPVHAYEVGDFKIAALVLAANEVTVVQGGSINIVPGTGPIPQTSDGWGIATEDGKHKLRYRAFGTELMPVTYQIVLEGFLYPAIE